MRSDKSEVLRAKTLQIHEVFSQRWKFDVVIIQPWIIKHADVPSQHSSCTVICCLPSAYRWPDWTGWFLTGWSQVVLLDSSLKAQHHCDFEKQTLIMSDHLWKFRIIIIMGTIKCDKSSRKYFQPVNIWNFPAWKIVDLVIELKCKNTHNREPEWHVLLNLFHKNKCPLESHRQQKNNVPPLEWRETN